MTVLRWFFGLTIAALLAVGPYVYYRAAYAHSKRIHEVTPGVLYRSGQLTQAGMADVIRQYQIKTVINAQDEYPDPDIEAGYFDRSTVKESTLLRGLGVRYIHLAPDLVHPSEFPAKRPETIDRFLAILDDPANHPVLIHCKAGLHRTGCLVGVYRMEYEDWSPRQALDEIKANGFGNYKATSANMYILQYILGYRAGVRHTVVGAEESTGAKD